MEALEGEWQALALKNLWRRLHPCRQFSSGHSRHPGICRWHKGLFREMISLRGLTGHTVKSYSTYIRAYLDYLSSILHKMPEDVSWEELCDFIRWLQKEKKLSGCMVNTCISQLCFLRCMYSTDHGILHSFLSAGLIPIFHMCLHGKMRSVSFPQCRISSQKPCVPSCIPPACALEITNI